MHMISYDTIGPWPQRASVELFHAEEFARPSMASGPMALVTGAKLTKHRLKLEPISYVCICCRAISLFEAAPVCT